MLRRSLLVTLSLVLGAIAGPSCTSVTLTVTATANNIALPTSLNLTTLKMPSDYQALTTLPTQVVSGTYEIAAVYCEPEVKKAKRHDTLQLLVHGVTFTLEYWFGDGFNPSIYSYVNYASQQGYPTLAFDRICNGNSSKPNGLLACQLPLNTAILNNIIDQVEQTAVLGGRKFTQVLPVCHSEGSTICQYNMQLNPAAKVGAYVLTGFSNQLLLGAPGSYLAGKFLPAAEVNPAQYGSLLLDPSYQLATSQRGIEGIFFAGDYSHALAVEDFAHTHPLTLGELATAPLSQFAAPKYTGKVFLLNGARDQIFCSTSVTGPLVGFQGDCGSGASSTTAGTKVLFPHAQFQYAQVANTGHCIDLHFTAPSAFVAINNYLTVQGF